MIPSNGQSLPDVLLGYQKKLMLLSSTSKVVFCEKSRRIGMTWGIAADAVLTASASKSAKGMDVFYIGYNLDMAREFIDTCGGWAKSFSYAATEVEEFVFTEQDEKGADRSIQAFRIKFGSGFEICALSSRPRSLRGRQGYIIIDEAAFHDDFKELMKSALAMLIWGGKVLVISTHDGVDNAFNQYLQDIKAGRLKYETLRVDFDEALKDGLYKRICLVTGKEWSEASEKEWRDEIVEFYADDADEELFCIPRKSGGAYLPTELVESRMIDAPVVRYAAPDWLVMDPERTNIITKWCEENLKPLLDVLDQKAMHFFGEDFGRSGDQTVLWPLAMKENTTRTTPFTVELHNVPFKLQEQIVFYIIDRLPNFQFGSFDARGNGSALAEAAKQEYGEHRIAEVMITGEWYGEAFPKYKSALEDARMEIPQDADVLADHRVAQVIKGRPAIPELRTKGKDGKKRHGDSLVAALMAYWSTLQDIMEYGYETINKQQKTSQMKIRAEDDDDDAASDRSFGQNRGAW